MTSLAEKAVTLHEHLATAACPHAFGGALALAWCTRAPRGTSDIDVNIFLPETEAAAALDALPPQVARTGEDLRQLGADGQARLWWDTTPVDVFLSTTSYHDAAATRVHWEPFAGRLLPFLACRDLAVFKAFFNRRRDWADLEDMLVAGTLDVSEVSAVLAEHLGGGDERIAALWALDREHRPPPA